MSETRTYVVPECMGGNDNDLAKFAMLNNGGFNNWGNNPFFYLIWMWMMRYMNLGYGNEMGNPQYTALQATLRDNQNSDLLMSAIKGNENAIHEFSATTGLNFAAVQNAICGVRSSISEIGAQLGFSAERVINAVQAGDCGVIQAIKDCCCQNQQNILKMGYENQLASQQQTQTITNGINGLSNSLDRNAATIEYNSATQTCALQNTIKDASSTSTQAILAKLDAIEDARKDREINTLTAQLAAVNAKAERQAELAPLYNQITEVRRNQPSTTTIEYPQLTAIPSAALYGVSPYFNTGVTGYWG